MLITAPNARILIADINTPKIENYLQACYEYIFSKATKYFLRLFIMSQDSYALEYILPFQQVPKLLELSTRYFTSSNEGGIFPFLPNFAAASRASERSRTPSFSAPNACPAFPTPGFPQTSKPGLVSNSHILQACHLDILMKTQGKKLKLESSKLKTKKNQKIKDFLNTLKILENLNILCTNFH